MRGDLQLFSPGYLLSSLASQEVEQLLEPEEKAILQKNEVPDFTKLTSPKWIPFHTLATSGQILLMDDLLKHGFDVNVANKDLLING